MRAKRGNRAVPAIGIIEWFTPNDCDSVERLLADMRALDTRELRTGISGRDLASAEHSDAGQWYGWLFERLAREVNVLPCISCSSGAVGGAPGIATPPRDPRAYAAFLEKLIGSYGQYFEWIELRSEPKNLYGWDSRLEPDWHVFSDMVTAAARTARKLGKRAVLAGMCPMDLSRMRLMLQREVMESIDAVGINGFPGTWEFGWEDWSQGVAHVRRLLKENGSQAEVWITKTGYSTWHCCWPSHGWMRSPAGLLTSAAVPATR